jgi:hypothetical protein
MDTVSSPAVQLAGQHTPPDEGEGRARTSLAVSSALRR